MTRLIKPVKIGNSHYMILPKRKYRGWLDAVAFHVGWLTKDEINALMKKGFMDNKKVFVAIPIFEGEPLPPKVIVKEVIEYEEPE